MYYPATFKALTRSLKNVALALIMFFLGNIERCYRLFDKTNLSVFLTRKVWKFIFFLMKINRIKLICEGKKWALIWKMVALSLARARQPWARAPSAVQMSATNNASISLDIKLDVITYTILKQNTFFKTQIWFLTFFSNLFGLLCNADNFYILLLRFKLQFCPSFQQNWAKFGRKCTKNFSFFVLS